MSILELTDVVVGYEKGIDILQGLTLTVDSSSDIVSIIGPNGAGKSTIIKTIFGFLRPRVGKIVFDKADISKNSPLKAIKSGIVYLPQETSVFPKMTVRENLEMGAYTRIDDGISQDIEGILEEFPLLKEKEKDLAGNLSGGQAQLLELARALLLSPRLIMMDEPTAGLEPRAQRFIFEKIKEINIKGTTILLVEQNAKSALRISTYAYIIRMGKTVFRGTEKEILENKELSELYLGG